MLPKLHQKKHIRFDYAPCPDLPNFLDEMYFQMRDKIQIALKSLIVKFLMSRCLDSAKVCVSMSTFQWRPKQFLTSDL